jgi:hypothetical protein
LGAADVPHMRSALDLSSIYRQQKGWLMAASPAENLCCCARIKTEQRVAFQSSASAQLRFVNFALHDVANATKLEGKHPTRGRIASCVICDASPH